MPTIVGIFFFVFAIFLFFRKSESLLGLVIVSSIFQASSIYSSDSHGIQPYYMVAALFVLQSILRGRISFSSSRSFLGKRWMIAFTVIALASATLAPIVFAGIPVYDPYVGIDDGLFIRPPLHISLANFTQSVYLLLDVFVLLGAAGVQRVGGNARKAYSAAFYVLAGIVILQFLCATVGISFPYELIQTHGGYSNQTAVAGDLSSRFAGTFTESSGAGLAFVTFAAGFLAERLKHGKSLIPILVGLLGIFLVRSSASLLTIAVVFISMLITNRVFRFPYYIDRVTLKRSLFLIILGAIAIAAALLSPLRSSIEDLTVGKSESSSYINRLAADAYAIQLFVQTKGIGVGMGSNRPSSLLTSLLSTVGIGGFVSFLMMFIQILRNQDGEDAWIRWAGFALILDMVFENPDFTSPWLWGFLALAVQTRHLSELEQEIAHLPGNLRPGELPRPSNPSLAQRLPQ